MSMPPLSTMAIYLTAGENKVLCISISKVHRKQGYLVTAAEQFLTNKFFSSYRQKLGAVYLFSQANIVSFSWVSCLFRPWSVFFHTHSCLFQPRTASAQCLWPGVSGQAGGHCFYFLFCMLNLTTVPSPASRVTYSWAGQYCKRIHSHIHPTYIPHS